MYEHSLDPIAVSLGPISIYWYGVVYAVGLLFLYYYLRRYADDLLSETLLDSYIVWVVIGMLLGSRVFTFLFWHPVQLLQNPFSFFAVWEGGMSFHGAYTGVVLASLWFCNRENVSFHDLADVISIPLGALLGIGRLANFVNAELVGTVTTVSWCVNFPGFEECRHPYQLYAAVKNALLTPLLYGAYKAMNLPSGMVFWLFTWSYNTFRFFVDFYRAEPDVVLGLSTGQFLSIGFVALASYMMIYAYRQHG